MNGGRVDEKEGKKEKEGGQGGKGETEVEMKRVRRERVSAGKRFSDS